MGGLIALIIVAVGVFGGFGFFVLKSFVVPKRLSRLLEMLEEGKVTVVSRMARRLVAKEPRNAEAHYLLGRAYEADGRPELAAEEFRIVNDIGVFEGICTELEFRRHAGKVFAAAGLEEEALKEYALLIQAEPGVAEYYYRVGELLEGRNNSKKAFGFYLKAAQMDERNLQAQLKVGVLLYRAGKATEAKQALEKVLKLQERNTEAAYYLGRIAREAGDFRRAVRYFQQAQRDSALKVKALVESGACFASMGDRERAVSDLGRAIKNAGDSGSPEVLYARYFLAGLYEKNREYDKAIAQWEKIYAKKPSFRDVGKKLSEYQDLRSDDRMKDFLTAGSEEFIEICKKLCAVANLEPDTAREVEEGCEIIATEESSDFRAQRRMKWVALFLRTNEAVGETVVRRVLERMKSERANRGMVVCSGTYSRTARTFAETRPIHLVDREKLSGLLQKIEL